MNSKILSLVLLSSIAMSAVAKKDRKDRPDHQDKHDRHDRHDRKKRKDCDADGFERNFEIKLSFCQELVAANNGAGEEALEEVTYVPRPVKDTPLGVRGKIEICFAKDLCSLKYRLFVFGADGRRNQNELITMAHFHVARASQNGPITAFLFDAGKGFGCGVASNGLLQEGCLTNADIIPVISPDGNEYNSIASLLDGIRNGDVYVNVHGSNTCDPNKTGFAGGILRGQVFARETSG